MQRSETGRAASSVPATKPATDQIPRQLFKIWTSKSSVDPMTEDTRWRRNLVVCVGGSFTTIVAMTMLVPYLPIFVEQLGVHDQGSVLRWSGIAYGATFFTAALAAPLWGALGDRFGRKSMLIRASGTLKNGREVGYWVRATDCCRRSHHGWLITHEHVSLPVDIANGKAVMNLVPGMAD